MNNLWIKRVAAFFLVILLLVTACACEMDESSSKGSSNKHNKPGISFDKNDKPDTDSDKNDKPDTNSDKNDKPAADSGKNDSASDAFDTLENTVALTYSFSNSDSSETLRYNPQQLQTFCDQVASTSVTYGYQELFDYERAMAGILVDHTVKKHKCSALDSAGKLTEEHLFDVVKQNNAEFLENMPSILKDVDDVYLTRICEILVDVVNETLEKYPNIDKDRVYCNLGNLKVVEKGSALDFAAVEPGMVLHINKNMFEMVEQMTSGNMYNVILHEAMHIIQYGCECEEIEGCVRRCGLAHSYSESTTKQDYSDWLWLAEGSAELLACHYANVAPMTYQNMVNYIETLNFATMLQEDIPANFVETLCFYPDVEQLFALFGASTEAQKQEIYRMIYSLEIMQMGPTDVKQAYERIYGVAWSDEIHDNVNISVKRPVIQTLTKCFFINLAQTVCSNNISKNDFLFLLNLYESTINYHLELSKSEYDQHNAAFCAWYASARNALFACLENVSAEDYSQYVAGDGTDTIHAGMTWLDQDKQTFLIAKFEKNLCDYKFPVS